MADPIHQFQINKIFTVGHIGGQEIAFTNSSAFMFAAVAVITLLMVGGSAARALIPGRFQSLAELSYEFVSDTLRSSVGEEGMKFFPLVFTLFMFILTANLIGIIPYTFTVTSHLIVTLALAMTVFLTVLLYGLYKNGFKFFKLFVPHGIPIYILPLIVVIEVISFLSRPVSHSVRLFANMLAGHITLKVFAGFVVSLSAAGFLGTVSRRCRPPPSGSRSWINGLALVCSGSVLSANSIRLLTPSWSASASAGLLPGSASPKWVSSHSSRMPLPLASGFTCWKFAVTVFAASMATVVEALLASVMPVPVQLTNCHPLAGVAVIGWALPV